MAAHAAEVASGKRFEFGENWARFLASHTPQQIARAERSLQMMLGLETLAGRTFIDIGSGSGLFSLAARRLGATVCSVDYDPQSVACTHEMRRRYFGENDAGWDILEGSVLSGEFLARLGCFDIVYSWGVLHHTGAMWEALANIAPLVAGNGWLFISIYNDQGTASKRWWKVKKLYNRLPRQLRWMVVLPSFVHLWWRPILRSTLHGRPLAVFKEYGEPRGMSLWRDVVDWVGGYPFEVAKPEEIFRFYRDRGFTLRDMKTNGGSLGCNEFVFRKAADMDR